MAHQYVAEAMENAARRVAQMLQVSDARVCVSRASGGSYSCYVDDKNNNEIYF